MSNSIIQETRSIREQYAASMGYDLDRVFADLKTRQEKHAAEGWIIIQPPSNPPLEPNLLQQTRFARC